MREKGYFQDLAQKQTAAAHTLPSVGGFLGVNQSENFYMPTDVGSIRNSIANNVGRPSTIKKTIKGGGGTHGRMSSRALQS
jgi:hypothetical protein